MCRYIHYFVNSKSIPYHQGRTYSRFDGLVLTLKFLSRPYTLEKTRKPSAQFKNKPVESYFFKSKSISYHLFSFFFSLSFMLLQDGEKVNNQSELWLLTLSVTSFSRPPSSATWGTPTTWFVSRLTKLETTSKLQVKLIHYLVHLHRLKIPPLDGGKVLPEKMSHLPMRQIRQVKMIPHSDT